jgi:hypothetical protein
MTQPQKYFSIFSPSTANERKDNFDTYWDFTREHSGELLEKEQLLSKKHAKLQSFQDQPVQLQQVFQHPEAFYRNYVHLQDDTKTLDRKTLLLTCIYKFARHEWVGITGAWAATPDMANCRQLTDRISRYHLAEEFSHIRLFHEMFRTFRLDQVEWVPLGAAMRKVYEVFPRLPENLMSPFAFVTELMGIMFYRRVDALLDDVFADEPAAGARLRELLNEITIDELAHIGQRRNYLGPVGLKLSQWLTPSLFRMFFRDIPETALLFDLDRMIQEALAFDYSEIPAPLMKQTWVPSYCMAAA